jgi:DNA-directed RNA polymerase specialized sigma24 family protein
VTSVWQEERGFLDAHARKIALFRAARQAARSMPWRETELLRGVSDTRTSADELQDAARCLPPLEREAIWLAFDAALCCEEIGEVLSLTGHEAAHLIVRALKRLKGELG